MKQPRPTGTIAGIPCIGVANEVVLRDDELGLHSLSGTVTVADTKQHAALMKLWLGEDLVPFYGPARDRTGRIRRARWSVRLLEVSAPEASGVVVRFGGGCPEDPSVGKVVSDV
jgi:hypothetical protein